jgi:hypothetical protein
MKYIFALFVSVVLLGYSTVFAADIGLSPARLDLTVELGETITETVTLLTDAIDEQQIQVEVSDFTLDPVGELTTLPAGSLDYSSATWLQPELTDFVLAGGEGRDFRVSVAVPNDASLEGTYHAMVFFTVVPPPSETDGIGVITTTRIGLAIYVTVTNSEDNSAELVDFFQNDEKTMTFAIANTGNTVMRLGGQVELRNEAGETKYVVEIPDVPVLRDSEREITLELPAEMESGFYTALALIEDSRSGLLVGELPIEVE